MAIQKKTKNTKTGQRKIKYPKVEHGRIYVKCLFNNTIVSLTRQNGDVLKQFTPSQLGYKHCKKNTSTAVQDTLIETAKTAIESFGMRRVDVILNGPGIARDMVNYLTAYKPSDPAHVLQIESINDTTSVPHGGCRPAREAKR